MALFDFLIPKKMTPEQTFWQWFVGHEDELFHFERNQEAVFDALQKAMGLVHKDLAFEFGPVKEGRREFVISACGIKSAFLAVVSLADQAPSLKRWRVLKFRQRHTPLCDIEIHGLKIKASDVEFTLLTSKDAVGLYLFLPGYTEERKTDFGNIGYLMLDQALGEYDVVAKLGPIKMMGPDAAVGSEKYPLKELPTMFDQVWSRLSSQ